jgi:hypothetical protein
MLPILYVFFNLLYIQCFGNVILKRKLYNFNLLSNINFDKKMFYLNEIIIKQLVKYIEEEKIQIVIVVYI